MATAGHFSPENEYFCRYFRLVNETAAKPLRKIVENTAGVRHMSVDAFLLTYKATMKILCTRGIIQKQQFDIMYPKTVPFCIENLDICLLCVILKNICNVSSNGKAAYEDIRKFRNELCHNPVIALTRLDYNNKFSNVHDAIKILLQECNDATFEAEIEKEIKNIDESPVSISPVMNLFKDFLFAQDSQFAQTFSERISHLEASVTDKFTSTNENLKVIYAKVEKQSILTAKTVRADTQPKEVNQMIETLLSKNNIDLSNNILMNIRTFIDLNSTQQTGEVLKRKSDYVLTQQFFEAENILLSSGNVVISGGAGEGKTHAAYEIMRRNGQVKKCIQIQSPDDMRFVDPEILDFVFIDDIFGNCEVDESKLQSWIHVMDKLQQLVRAKTINLIITTREMVLKECRKSLEKFSIFHNKLSLSSKKLSHQEKTDILSKVLAIRQKQYSCEEIQCCVKAFKSDLGFPYTCVLFASDDSFFREGASFFKHNSFMTLVDFTKLHDCKQITLLFLWIKDATRPTALNRNKENDVILKKISRMLKYEYAIDLLYDQVNQQCKVLDGVFVNAGPYGYQFTHNAVYQSIGLNFARVGYYDLILEYSNLAFFMESISVTENHYQPDRVFIRNEFYQNLVDRIIIEVTERNHCREMAMHSCLTKEVLCLLVKTLKREKQIKDFFLSENEYCNSNTFLSHLLEICAAESCSFLKQLRDQLRCAKLLFHNKKQCKICDFYLEAYHSACRGGNIEALKIMNFVKCDSSILRDAAYSGNISMYEYIVKTLDLTKDAENEKRALHIAIEKEDLEMYRFIRQKGCMPDNECLRIASEVRNSELLVHIILDMYASDVLHEDGHLKRIKSTIFSMNILETLILVGLCPTKEDILLSMNADIKAIESILWDLKYKVKGKPSYINAQVTKLLEDINKDPYLKKKLIDIGVLNTHSYLDRQVQKGNSEKIDLIIQHFQRNDDWDPNGYRALNLLNQSLPDQKIMFKFLLNKGVIPSYTTLFKSVEAKDINIVKMTLSKMKEAGQFDPSHKGSKQALLQSTLSCNIYNCLIDEGMEPKAYHLLYAVESDVGVNQKIEVIENVYLMSEKCKCLLKFDEKVMQLALLGGFDDIEVYTCLLKPPFKLQSCILPTIVSRGSATEVERFITTLKVQKDWPPSIDTTKLSLECCFYNPSIFEILMKEDCHENTDDYHKLLAYRILYECRLHSFRNIKEYISILQNNNIWNQSDIVMKCSLLESSDDQATCELFEENGVSADDILDTARETENSMLQSYVTACLSKKGHKIKLSNLDEGMIKSLSSFPLLCNGHLLKRAVCVSDKEVVMNIFDTLNKTDPHFVNSELATEILELSSERLDIYSSLLEKGFIPTFRCLLTLVKSDSYESYTSFHDTIECLDNVDKLPRGDNSARKLVHESLKHDITHFYVTLTEYGIKGRFEDIRFAINANKIPICKLIVNDLQKDLIKECPEGIDFIILKCFPLYKIMHAKGLQLTSSVLLKLTHSYLRKQISFCNMLSLFEDYFSSQLWSFEDDDLLNIYKLSLGDRVLFLVLDIYFKSEKESYFHKCLMSRDKEAMEKFLIKDSYNSKRVLSKVLRKSAISRKRLDNGCKQLMMEWIENNECDPSLKILSSVLYSDTENTLQIIYELSEEMKATLDTEVLETALEEAIFDKKTGIYCSILKECRVKPTTYCLLYSIYHNNDTCFKTTLKKLPTIRKTCRDPYYKTSLALCCQKSEHDKFKTLLNESKLCDTELLYEAALCKNELMIKLVKENLIKHNQWDFSLKDYWIASALIEADENSSIKSHLESYYDDTVSAQIFSNYEKIGDKRVMINMRTNEVKQNSAHMLTAEDQERSEDSECESLHEYDILDNDSLRENAYLTPIYVKRDYT